MDLSLIGKNAFVCGSTQGIGKASALELAKLGARITLIARNEDKLKKVVEELRSIKNINHDYICVDFNNPDQLKQKVAEYISKGIKIHILVNNTGGPPGGQITKASTDEFIKAFSNHLICNQILVQAVLPGMEQDQFGRIINIISTSVKQPIKGLGVSNTTRGAVASWSKTLSGEVAKFGITVNNVLPGATNTGRLKFVLESRAKNSNKSFEEVANDYKSRIPADRFAEPEEVAYAVAFLASPSASYITGTSLPVDGGRIEAL